MTDKNTAENSRSRTDLHEEGLFKLQCLIKIRDIQHTAQIETGQNLLLAVTTGNSDIILYYKKSVCLAPVIKRIPWFQGCHKQITALCFNSLGSYLLCTSIDGSLYIIPALSLVDEKCSVEKKWNTNDITAFPPSSTHSPLSRPTAVVWWHDPETSNNIGIVGTEYGEIVFINLDSGKQVGIAHVNGNIVSLHVCQYECKDSLLITSQSRQQWRLLLEQSISDDECHSRNGDSSDTLHPNGIIHDNAKNFISTRSRLQGLKQLSVEKLAILRQKLVETKNQSLSEVLRYQDAGNNKTIGATGYPEQYSVNQGTTNPEPISRDTFLTLQYDRQYTCHHSSTNHITVHRPNSTTASVTVHKMFGSCKDIILTARLFFITDIAQKTVYVISTRLSEASTNRDCDFNKECIIGDFSFENSKETILALYKATEFINPTFHKHTQDVENKYVLPNKLEDLKIELPQMDTCIIVTSQSVYKVVLRKPLLSVFGDLVLKKNELEKAGTLASIFGLNAQQLLEYAGDILLSNKEFQRAIAFYKLSKCRLLKSVLKFASAGHISELLSCLTHCLTSPAISELPIATRIHLSNLCVLAFTEMTLRATAQQSKVIYNEFLYFLSTNTYYDELLAINIAGQTCLWEVLHHLATQRGLYGQMLDILMKTTYPLTACNSRITSYGLVICLSEPSLMQAMIINPDLARGHISFTVDNLSDLQIFVLQRLVTLYDPTNPVLRSLLVQCQMRHRTTSHSSQSSQCDSIDFIDNDEADTLIEEIVETFLLVLLTLIYKKASMCQDSTYMYSIHSLGLQRENTNIMRNVDFRRRALSAGFSHVAVIRNNNLYTWGNSIQGCLGTGPSVLRYGSPHAICFFQRIKVEVLSVSCGHCHTLATTNNGVYAWGSSQYGQLGLGKVLQCSSPELIISLAQEVIVDAVAGQYHSVALTADGRVFTWGWGVHGQLGHGNTDEKSIPALVTFLLGIFVRQISAGHAHTLALSEDGIVYAFGCNVFGQLGIGTNVKSSIPMKVLLPERTSLIATAYFHNLALSNTNKLYIWGASPQVLRSQAQAQKRIRRLEQQENIIKKAEGEAEDCGSEGQTSVQTDEPPEFREMGAQNKNTQEKSYGTDTPKKRSNGTNYKNINVGLLEEAQTHLKPTLVDTSLVRGQIVQISTGCHHNALLTKDGSLYTWGRNLDGQIGNNSKREVLFPTPLSYNPASMFAQVPPRHKKEEEEQDSETDTGISTNDETDEHITGETASRKFDGDSRSNTDNREIQNPTIKAVVISCGYDYTVVIQPGGAVLAWGNNNRAQLGRVPAKDVRDADDKLFWLKSSKRVLRLPHLSHTAMNIPSQVPNIAAPVISYQSYDVTPLAGLIQPLSVIEKSPGETTLHYVLEYFSGLYDSTKIIKKCLELENYQACSKIAKLQGNICDAFSYELMRLNSLSSKIPWKGAEDTNSNNESPLLTCAVKRNTELFNEQVEKNLIESVEDTAAKNRMKIPVSKSLNSLQMLEQELYSFDCQGGSEDLCKDSKCEDTSLDVSEDAFENDFNAENFVFDNDLPLDPEINVPAKNEVPQMSEMNVPDTETVSPMCKDVLSENKTAAFEKGVPHSERNNITNETIKVIKYYLSEIENETDTVKCKLLQSIIDFWTMHALSMQRLEHVFLEHIHIIYYPLGLLLFCEEIMQKYFDANENNVAFKNLSAINLFSTKFCLQICSMLFQHIDKEQPTAEYIKLLSSLTADLHGPPITGYPGSSENSTTEEMIEGIISTMSSKSFDCRTFVHLTDTDAVHRFLEVEEDSMVFTCGHHFPSSVYQTEVISEMETELLTSQSMLLPSTAQFLGKLLSQTNRPEILCPLCIPRALSAMVNKSND